MSSDQLHPDLDALYARLDRLERSNQDLEQFAYVAAHDLQEPLRIVSTYTQLLASECGQRLTDEERSYVGYILQAANRMGSLIRDLLSYSTLSQESTTESVDCAKTVEEVLNELRIPIQQSGAKISVGELPTLTINRFQFAQLMHNLITNAIKFRAKNMPIIRIEAAKVDGEWIFSCTDNGIGIEEQYHQRVFEPLYRLQSANQHPGNGIGLAFCKKIVDSAGGRIWVTSQVGSGSTFRFALPVACG